MHMIIRNDLKNSGAVIPAGLLATIKRVGGTNLYDEPMFRLVRAEDRITKASGEWNIWPENASLDERGGLGIEHAQQLLKAGASANQISEYFAERLSTQPIRVVRGMQETPLYAFSGWILEKWKPAHMFGSPQEWYSFRFEGEAALGPYPENGEYELVAGPTPYMLTEGQVEDAIRQHFREMDEKPVSAAQRVLVLLNRIEEQQKQLRKKIAAEAKAMESDGPMSLRNRLSLGAGRVIQAEATKAGLKGHFGN